MIEHFDCICFSNEHTLRFVYIEEYNELYLDVYLHQYRNIFKRVWVAIKYVFGYKSKYGHWDWWSLRPEDTKRMIELLEQVKDPQ